MHQWEHDEEDEIQEEKRHNEGRFSHIMQHSRSLQQEEPVYEDPFTKRLGQRSKSTLRSREIERTNASLTTAAPRTLSGENSRSSRSTDVIRVNPRCCGFPCGGKHHDSHKISRFPSREPPTGSFKIKEPKSLGAVLAGKFSRLKPRSNVSHPPWENELASFREHMESQMKEVRDMFQGMQEGMQEIYRDLKRSDSYREDTSLLSSRRRTLFEAVTTGVDGVSDLGHSKRQTYGVSHLAHIRENGHHHHHPNRRATSVPKIRVNWDSGLHEEDSENARLPTAALFVEVIKVKRDYLRKFAEALMKFEDDLSLSDDVEYEAGNSNSLHDVVARLFPRANFANNGHFKYGIQAWLSRIIFKEEAQKSEDRVLGSAARRRAWAEYRRLSLTDPRDLIIHRRDDDSEKFRLFCLAKFDAIQNELEWLKEWPDELMEVLLEVSKHVWRAQHLALTFDPVASYFVVKTSQKFEASLMEPLETPPELFPSDRWSPSTAQVGFMVSPGYIVNDRVIKCQVCLVPDCISDF